MPRYYFRARKVAEAMKRRASFIAAQAIAIGGARIRSGLAEAMRTNVKNTHAASGNVPPWVMGLR